MSDNYNKQFTQMQKSLHKRLEEVSKQNQVKKSSEKPRNSDLKDTFGINDDLNLSTQGSSSLPLLEIENQSLNNEIRELRDETGRLRKYAAEKEYEIKQLNKKVRKLNEEKIILAGESSPAAAPTKIVELSKKNRDLNSVIEVEKNKNFRLQQKVTELETKLLRTNSSPVAQLKTSPSKDKEDTSEHLQAINMKLVESRNQVQSLKQELKIAHKVICQEIGEENVNLNSLLNGNSSGFRGRSIQIKALQTKVKDLERKLKGLDDFSGDKNFKNIKMVEKTRKESIEAIKSDLLQAQSETQDMKKRWESSKARNRVLVAEVKSLKSQGAILAEKGKHDNELIETLMKQQERLQQLLEVATNQQTDAVSREAEVSKTLYEKDQQTSSEIALLKSLLEKREEQIRELEDQMSSPTQRSSIRDSIELTRSCLSSRSEKRVESRTIGICTDQNIGISGISSPFKDETTELELKCAELTAMLKVVKTEKDKLFEINNLLCEREQKLNSEMCKLNSIHSEEENFTKNHSAHQTAKGSKIEQKLYLQMDENNALKETLESLQKAHAKECRLYDEMIQETKQVFLETIRGLINKPQ